MNWKPLDRLDSELYKGLAILLIVTHNFMHLFPSPQENEFEFNQTRLLELFNLIFTEPENTLRILLSFFGHFGVQIFIFLSAYGLTKKFLKRSPSYWEFIGSRLLKIYPAFILAIITWLMLQGWLYPGYGLLGPFKVAYWNIESLLLKLTLISNFVPEKSLIPIGPWWFIPFIFQFYLAFPVMLKLYLRWRDKALMAMAVVAILITMLSGGHIAGVNVYFTILGHFPELCLGIYIAGYEPKKLKIPTIYVLAALGLYLLGNIYQLFWYLSHICFLIIILAVFNHLMPRIKKAHISKKFLLFLGGISMPLFLVNGFLREPFISWAIQYNDWLLTIGLCLLSLTLSILVSMMLLTIEKRIMAKVTLLT